MIAITDYRLGTTVLLLLNSLRCHDKQCVAKRELVEEITHAMNSFKEFPDKQSRAITGVLTHADTNMTGLGGVSA